MLITNIYAKFRRSEAFKSFCLLNRKIFSYLPHNIVQYKLYIKFNTGRLARWRRHRCNAAGHNAIPGPVKSATAAKGVLPLRRFCAGQAQSPASRNTLRRNIASIMTTGFTSTDYRQPLYNISSQANLT